MNAFLKEYKPKVSGGTKGFMPRIRKCPFCECDKFKTHYFKPEEDIIRKRRSFHIRFTCGFTLFQALQLNATCTRVEGHTSIDFCKVTTHWVQFMYLARAQAPREVSDLMGPAVDYMVEKGLQ